MSFLTKNIYSTVKHFFVATLLRNFVICHFFSTNFLQGIQYNIKLHGPKYFTFLLPKVHYHLFSRFNFVNLSNCEIKSSTKLISFTAVA